METNLPAFRAVLQLAVYLANVLTGNGGARTTNRGSAVTANRDSAVTENRGGGVTENRGGGVTENRDGVCTGTPGVARTANPGVARTAKPGGARTAKLGAAFTAVVAVALTACAPAVRAPATPAPTAAPAPTSAPAPTPAPAAPATRPAPPPFQWVRKSAEHRAVYLEIFRSATVHLDSLAAGRPAGPWGIITDGDETIMDNSEYEAGRAEQGLGFTEESWSVWVRREAAPALPGARAFLDRVHALGGRVVVVTNRREALCPATRANLRKDGLDVDLVLCRGETSDKNPRFEAVQSGTASADFPALHVLMWLGDNIQDFPHLSQSTMQQPDSAFGAFGRNYFMLPNPMYGSWQR